MSYNNQIGNRRQILEVSRILMPLQLSSQKDVNERWFIHEVSVRICLQNSFACCSQLNFFFIGKPDKFSFEWCPTQPVNLSPVQRNIRMNMEGQFLTNRHFLTFSLRTFVRFSENCWNFNSDNSEHLSIDPYIFYLHYPLRSLRTVGLKDVKNNFGCFVYDVKILALPHRTPRVLEKRWNKVRKRILYTEMTSL